jgi:hypothetical protein
MKKTILMFLLTCVTMLCASPPGFSNSANDKEKVANVSLNQEELTADNQVLIVASKAIDFSYLSSPVFLPRNKEASILFKEVNLPALTIKDVGWLNSPSLSITSINKQFKPKNHNYSLIRNSKAYSCLKISKTKNQNISG